MTSRDERDSFETFYKAVRDDLLLQTYALTGDLSASEKAVRDALVVAWHHWRKVSQLDDPGNWVRPLAWSRAQRRHTARWWHRQRDIPAEVKATLDALGALTFTQRKALLLTTLTAQPLESIASEVGLSRAALERELQLANAQFSLTRDVSPTQVRSLIEAMRTEVASTRWPRPTILLRAGTARRRSHTTLGVAAAIAATVVSGSLVTDADGVTPDLTTKGVVATPERAAPSQQPAPPSLDAAELLGPDDLAAVAPGTWTAGATSRNTEGDGLNITCQQSRYADPQGVGVLVRTSTAPLPAPAGRKGDKKGATTQDPIAVQSAVQSVEASADAAAATTAYDLTRTWYGVCTAPRVQLLSTYDIAGVGDAASLFVLRSWNAPTSTVVVGVARTGELTTTVSTALPGTDDPALDRAGALLGAAIARLCEAPGAGACTTTPAVSATRPLPIEAAPAMIGELDLPPVGDVVAAWAGTPATPATTNDAATRCDMADFSGGGFSNASTRSFVIPDATDLPPQFGLTETVGSLPDKQAKAFVESIRSKLTACPEKDLGTDVTMIDQADSERRSLTAWKLRVEITDDKYVDFKMAIMRSGTSVAQLGFIAGPDADLGDEDFRALVARAMQRLDALPPPA